MPIDVRRPVNPRAYTLWNRAILGMMVPGDYWFLTLTSSMDSSRDIKLSWREFYKRWFQKFYPNDCLYAIVNEGYLNKGVIHAVIRFVDENAEKPSDDLVSANWMRCHKAYITDFHPVKHFDKTANYLVQRHNKTAQELLRQPSVRSWRYTRDWVPVGFGKGYGRLWYYTLMRLPDNSERGRIVRDFVLACRRNPLNLRFAPYLENRNDGMMHLIENYVD
jgi:hypothetical protein